MDETIKRIRDVFKNKLHQECISIDKNSDSTDGNVYIIKCTSDKYVAKVYTNKSHAESMIKLHRLVSSKIQIPQIIYTNLDDEINSQYIVIYSFVKGTPIDEIIENGRIDIEIIKKIGKTIRQMHDTTSQDNLFDLPLLPFDTINQRKSMLHFDLTKSNIFLENTGDISIIDFDDAMYGSAIYDVSILIAFFFFSETRGVDLKGMNAFIEAYYQDNEELRNQETKHLKECVNQWVNYLISNNKLPNNLINCFKTKCQMINENL